MKYTIKGLDSRARREWECDNADHMDLIKEWFQDGVDMMRVFNNMRRKDTLKVIDEICMEYKNWYSNHELLGDLYKIAMTSLENRL